MKLKEAREELGISVRRFCEEAGISTRTLQDLEAGTREMRRATAVKVASVLARHGINPTDVAGIAEALGVGPRHKKLDVDLSGLYRDADLFAEIDALIDKRLEQLRAELEVEVRRLVEREVERRTNEESAGVVRRE